jgi:hypothetical protein
VPRMSQEIASNDPGRLQAARWNQREKLILFLTAVRISLTGMPWGRFGNNTERRSGLEEPRGAISWPQEDGTKVEAEERLCLRCQEAMTPGALRTTIESGFGHLFAVAGSNRVRWTGEGGPYRVIAYRCPSCGVVELAGTERPRASGCLSMLVLLFGLVIVSMASRCLLAN